jgi:hypothetical protein
VIFSVAGYLIFTAGVSSASCSELLNINSISDPALYEIAIDYASTALDLDRGLFGKTTPIFDGDEIWFRLYYRINPDEQGKIFTVVINAKTWERRYEQDE